MIHSFFSERLMKLLKNTLAHNVEVIEKSVSVSRVDEVYYVKFVGNLFV